MKFLLAVAALATLASALPGPVPAAPEAAAVVRSEEGARLQARCDQGCWVCYPGGCDCVC